MNPSPVMVRSEGRGGATTRAIAVCAALALLTAFVYGPTARNGYINLDDPEYVTKNPVVRQGLTWEGFVWGLRSTEQANWHPLTWWSHMLDASLFGERPGPRHLVNALLHATSSTLLFLALKAMTGAAWPSALVAALFAVHPLHVESVAWIAERKDVLCALFWTLALCAYSRHVRRPGAARLLAVGACFALALLAKPMAVTLPLVLLLLDWWPLGRRSYREKAPLLALSLLAGVVTLAVQSAGGAMTASHALGARLENALVSTATYLFKLLWPQHLGVFYPHPGASLPWWQWSLAGILLAAITLAAVLARRRQPWLATGWAWYLVTLAPVSGLIQVGEQGMADRYTYLTSIGLAIALAWWAADRLRRPPLLRAAVSAAAVAALAAVLALAGLARGQAARWRDSETLFRHTLAVAGDSGLLRTNLGGALVELERWEDALREFDIALRANPRDEVAWFNTGIAAAKLQRWAEAETAFRAVLDLNPADRKALFNLGIALAKQERWQEALTVYRAVVAEDPRDREARFNLGMIAVTLGDRATAEEQRAALESLDGRAAADLRAAMAGRGW